MPRRRLPEHLNDATVHERRERRRVIAVERRQIFGTSPGLEGAPAASEAGQRVNTSFVERQHATDRGRNARKSRRTYRFSKGWRVHEAMTYYTLYRYNFCRPVRALRIRGSEGCRQRRTPAMAAGLADHVWSPEEWLGFPAIQRGFPRAGE